MNTILITFLFLILMGVGTYVGIVVAQNITANESAMNSSTLQLSGNLTNTSSPVISNTT
jgi:hypothetical protein